VRLDINDASFVDIIHTAGQKFVGDFFSIGFLKPLGDVDVIKMEQTLIP